MIHEDLLLDLYQSAGRLRFMWDTVKDDKISLHKVMVLSVIAENGTCVPGVVRQRFGNTARFESRIYWALAEEGLITRKTGNASSTLLSITPKGREVVRRFRKFMDDIAALLWGDLDEGDLAAARRATGNLMERGK